jgi:hypothetical protein
MTVKLRLTGEPDEMARILDAIGSVLDVGHRWPHLPQRGGSGVRCHAEARLPTATSHGHHDEATPRPEPTSNLTTNEPTDEPTTD